MSTHTIGYYEEISKIIPILSSKYAPYLFFYLNSNSAMETSKRIELLHIGTRDSILLEVNNKEAVRMSRSVCC